MNHYGIITSVNQHTWVIFVDYSESAGEQHRANDNSLINNYWNIIN